MAAGARTLLSYPSLNQAYITEGKPSSLNALGSEQASEATLLLWKQGVPMSGVGQTEGWSLNGMKLKRNYWIIFYNTYMYDVQY